MKALASTALTMSNFVHDDKVLGSRGAQFAVFGLEGRVVGLNTIIEILKANVIASWYRDNGIQDIGGNVIKGDG